MLYGNRPFRKPWYNMKYKHNFTIEIKISLKKYHKPKMVFFRDKREALVV